MATPMTSRSENLNLLEMPITKQPAVMDNESLSNVTEDKSIRCCAGKKMKRETLLIILTVAGVALGILIGSLVKLTDPSQAAIDLVIFPGEILMRMLKMLIIPIIFTSVVTGLAHLDLKSGGKMGGHAFFYYLATTTIAVFLGIFLVSTIKPGNPDQQHSSGDSVARDPISAQDTFLDLIRNLFPDNIFAACFQVAQTKLVKIERREAINSSNTTTEVTNSTATPTYKKVHVNASSTNVLGIIGFSLFFGIILSSIGNEGRIVTKFLDVLNKIFMKMIMVVIWYSPVGICSLIAGNILKMKSIESLVETIGMYMVTVITGLLIHSLIILPLIYFAMTRKNPYRLYAGVLQAVFTGLGIASSAGTLPITMRCLEKNVGIDSRVVRFVLPLGATMNMDGTALMEGVAAITIAQMYSIGLSAGQIVTISITATVASIGAAAIPSAGLITLLLVLSAIGLPTETVGLLWSIDWFLDRLRTAVNICGDCIGAGIVYHINRDALTEDEDFCIARKEDNQQDELLYLARQSKVLLSNGKS